MACASLDEVVARSVMSQGDGTDPVVGMTGARFGGGRRRRRAAAEAAAAAAVRAVTEPLALVPREGSFESDEQGLAPGVGRTGARFGYERQDQADDMIDPGAFPQPSGTVEDEIEYGSYEDGSYEDRSYADGEFDETDSEEITHIAVRPYVLTGGRTRPAVDLAIEALVSVPAGAAADHQLDRRPDHAAVLELCDVPRSIAEIAALMQVALGVARVLVGDLAESGFVIVHRTSGAAGPDLALLERVLGGLRKL